MRHGAAEAAAVITGAVTEEAAVGVGAEIVAVGVVEIVAVGAVEIVAVGVVA